MTRTRATLTTFALAVAVAGCGGNDPLEPPTDPRDVSFAPALNVDLDRMTRTASGLYYEDIQTGTGDQARAGSIAHVYYVGWLVDGTQFDGRAAPNPPYSFTVAIGQVIQGWDEGVSGMLEGGIRKLVIPPLLGYGYRSQGPIPGNSVLVFQVELVGID